MRGRRGSGRPRTQTDWVAAGRTRTATLEYTEYTGTRVMDGEGDSGAGGVQLRHRARPLRRDRPGDRCTPRGRPTPRAGAALHAVSRPGTDVRPPDRDATQVRVRRTVEDAGCREDDGTVLLVYPATRDNYSTTWAVRRVRRERPPRHVRDGPAVAPRLLRGHDRGAAGRVGPVRPGGVRPGARGGRGVARSACSGMGRRARRRRPPGACRGYGADTGRRSQRFGARVRPRAGHARRGSTRPSRPWRRSCPAPTARRCAASFGRRSRRRPKWSGKRWSGAAKLLALPWRRRAWRRRSSVPTAASSGSCPASSRRCQLARRSGDC